MDKLLTFPGKTDQGIFTYVLEDEKSYLEKTASEYHPTIGAYLNNPKPIKGVMQVLITALGAGEWWGSNANGDYFFENDLAYDGPEYGHKTFETLARVYRLHVNKDPSRNYGHVILSVYNPKYHRVELIVGIDLDRGRIISDKVENGEYPEWSMGCKVPFDICNICNNRARIRREYCEHARHYLNKIWPETGQLVYVMNHRPKFHDISEVLIGADRTAKTLMKVAGRPSFFDMGSALAAEKLASGLYVPKWMDKSSADKSAAVKKAEISKRVPAEPPASQDAIRDLANTITETKAREKSIPTETLNRLGAMPLNRSLSTMGLLGILPKPREFQRIVLISVGKKDVADDLDRRNICFDPLDQRDPEKYEKMLDIDPSHFDERAFDIIRPIMPDRSYSMPHLAKRMVVLIKTAAETPPNYVSVNDERKPFGLVPTLLTVAGLYAAFAGKSAKGAPKNIDNLLLKHPGVAAAVGLSLISTAKTLFGDSTKGHYVEPRGAKKNVWNNIDHLRQKPFMKEGAFKMTPAKRLLIGAPSAFIASDILQKRKAQNPYAEEGSVRKFVRKYPDLITGALAADAYLSLGGKGSVISRIVGKGKQYLQKGVENIASYMPKGMPKAAQEEFLKTADAIDFLSSAMIYPLAFGSKNLPARIVGGLADQAVLEAGSRYLSRKAEKPGSLPMAKAASENPWDILFY